jgi:hypothetical protein
MLGFSLILYGKYYTGYEFTKFTKDVLTKDFFVDILDAFFVRMFVNIYFLNNNVKQKVKEKTS